MNKAKNFAGNFFTPLERAKRAKIKTIPHRDCVHIAQSDFSPDETKTAVKLRVLTRIFVKYDGKYSGKMGQSFPASICTVYCTSP